MFVSDFFDGPSTVAFSFIFGFFKQTNNYLKKYRWEPCSSDYRRRLTFKILWVRIPVPDTRWTFPDYNVDKIVMFV